MGFKAKIRSPGCRPARIFNAENRKRLPKRRELALCEHALNVGGGVILVHGLNKVQTAALAIAFFYKLWYNSFININNLSY